MALPDSRARLAAALARLQPRYVLPSHQDDFFRPLSAGFQFGPLTAFPFVQRESAQQSRSRLILLDYFRPMDTACDSKSQIPNTKSQAKDQILTLKWRIVPNGVISRSERFDLRNRVRAFVKQLPSTSARGRCSAGGARVRFGRGKLDRSGSGTEQERLSHAVKICRKEAKESRLFLRLIDAGSSQSTASARDKLAAEARELTLIFSAIISKSE